MIFTGYFVLYKRKEELGELEKEGELKELEVEKREMSERSERLKK